MSTLARSTRIASATALLGFVAGCGASAVAQPARAPAVTPAATTRAVATPVATATATAAAARRPTAAIDRVKAAAIRQYAAETGGGKSHALLHEIGRDRTLLRDLQSNNLSAVRSYVAQQFSSVWYHQHVSRMRILQGSQVVAEQGVPFVVAGPQMTLRGTNGRALGTLQVSIQDEIGFVRLMHRSNPVDVVVRGQVAGHVRTSLPAAANAQLPSSGSVTIAGRRYVVRSFHETAWANEPVTVWILAKG